MPILKPRRDMEKIHIISNSSQPFKDRIEAGRLLAQELKKYGEQDIVVLGIPRGGMVVADELARALEADLDIVLSRKLGAPGNPELAIGAVAEGGKLFLHEVLSGRFSDNDYIKKEKAHQLAEIQRRIEHYRVIRPKVKLTGKTVVVTDDGLATGATMQAALWAIRQERPKKLIVAVPVAPEDTVRKLADDADEILVLRTPMFFAAVGQFYTHFGQTDDEEVLSILKNRPTNK